MSGSIGGDRILRSQVLPTYQKYVNRVLNGFPGYKESAITGSFNAGTKKDHGDIDLVVYIDSSKDLKNIKKDFQNYLNGLSDQITVPFRTGRKQGEKSQLYGSIVTCQFPIEGTIDKYVQIDNIIVNTPSDMRFQNNFLNLDAPKQALLMGLVRVLPIKQSVLKKFELTDLPEPESNQEYEFVLSPRGLSFRLVTLTSDHKEASRVELWRSADWDNVLDLLAGYDINKTFEELLMTVNKNVKDRRSRERIVGIVKSMINVGVGEAGTPKGDTKQAAIDNAERVLLKNMSLKDYLTNELK